MVIFQSYIVCHWPCHDSCFLKNIKNASLSAYIIFYLDNERNNFLCTNYIFPGLCGIFSEEILAISGNIPYEVILDN